MKFFPFPKIIAFLLLFTAVVSAQDYDKVDRLVATWPKSFDSPDALAKRVLSDFKSDAEKSRAIYTWIALNVKYDLVEFRSNASGSRVAFSYKSPEEKEAKLARYNLDLAKKTLRTHKGVCRGYAALFDEVARLSGLETTTIPGSSKSHPTHIGKLPTSADHIWNAIKIKDEWKFVDVTWGSGSVNSESGKFVPRFNPGYFFTDPDVFFLNHFPDEKKWLLTNKSAEEFASLPLFSGQYINNGYEITFPKSGILPNNFIIPFKVANVSTTEIAYLVSSEDKFHPVTSVTKDGLTQFEVPLLADAAGYLTIYIGRDAIATFRIKKG